MSEYQNIVFYYLQLAKSFQWTPEQIDNMELDIFWDLIIVADLKKDENNPDSPKKGYIDHLF